MVFNKCNEYTFGTVPHDTIDADLRRQHCRQLHRTYILDKSKTFKNDKLIVNHNVDGGDDRENSGF